MEEQRGDTGGEDGPPTGPLLTTPSLVVRALVARVHKPSSTRDVSAVRAERPASVQEARWPKDHAGPGPDSGAAVLRPSRGGARSEVSTDENTSPGLSPLTRLSCTKSTEIKLSLQKGFSERLSHSLLPSLPGHVDPRTR